MSCFVFVVLAGGWGFSLFWGVVLAFRRVFSGFWGFLRFSFVLLLLAWGGGRVAGGSGVRGRRARVSCFLLVGGRVWGASARARFLSCPVLAVVGVGGRVRGARVARFPWWGSGCARFLLLLVVVGVFGCCFFPSGASRVLLVSGVGLRGLAGGWGLWGVSGWVRGCFFSGFCCTGPGLFGFGLGFVWRV